MRSICRCQSQTPRPVPTRQARTLGRSAGVRVLFAVVAGTLLGQVSGWWRLALSVSLFALACALSWTAARALGRHLRIDASVDSTHELVRSGPYRLVRHPIYTSMLCVLLGTGVLISPLYLLLPAVLIFLIGTEIRMQVEDRMLSVTLRRAVHGLPAQRIPVDPLFEMTRRPASASRLWRHGASRRTNQSRT